MNPDRLPLGDRPGAFGPWNKVYKRFRAWCQSGKWRRIFEAAVDEPDLEWAFIDGTYAKAHQQAQAPRERRHKQSGQAGRALPVKFTWCRALLAYQ